MASEASLRAPGGPMMAFDGGMPGRRGPMMASDGGLPGRRGPMMASEPGLRGAVDSKSWLPVKSHAEPRAGSSEPAPLSPP